MKYIDAEKLNAEIERLKAKYRKDMYKSNHEGLASGYKIEAYNELLSFLSTLESEKPINQEELIEEVKRYYSENIDYISSDQPTISILTNIEIEYSRQRAEECIPNDLEEAAGEYEKNHTYQRYDGGGLTPEYDATLAEAFVAGYVLCKEQMLKEAVEGTITCQNLNRYILVSGLDESLTYGDKVRIIIVKE